MGQAVAGQGAAIETWPSVSSAEKSISWFAAFLLHVLCGAGDRVTGDGGICVRMELLWPPGDTLEGQRCEGDVLLCMRLLARIP